jgi:hypothetical protein
LDSKEKRRVIISIIALSLFLSGVVFAAIPNRSIQNDGIAFPTINATTEFYRGGANYTAWIETLFTNVNGTVVNVTRLFSGIINASDIVGPAWVNSTFHNVDIEYYRNGANYTAWIESIAGGGGFTVGNYSQASRNGGANVGPRQTLNFIEGANITIAVVDDGPGNEVDITITSTGGAGGSSSGVTASITFGGSGDYVADGTDDQKTFQNAINAVGAAGGGTIFIGEGNYVFERGASPQVLVNFSNIKFWGMGRATDIQLTQAGNGFQIAATGDGFEAHNFFVHGQTTDNNQNAFQVSNGANDIVFDSLIVEDLGDHATVAATGHAFSIFGVTNENILIINNEVTNASGHAVFLEDMDNVRIIGNKFIGNQFGIAINPANNDVIDVVIANNICKDNILFERGDGIQVGKPGSSFEVRNFTITGNIASGNGIGNRGGLDDWTGHGIVLHSRTRYGTVTGNVANNNNAHGIEVLQQGSDLVISGNTVMFNGERVGEANLYASGIHVRAADANFPTRRVFILGNTASYNWGAGLEIFAQSADQVWDIHVDGLIAIGNAYGTGDVGVWDIWLNDNPQNCTVSNSIGSIMDEGTNNGFFNVPGMLPENLGDGSWLGIVVNGTAGEALSPGEVVYMETDGDYNLGDADATTTMIVAALAVESIGNGEYGRFLIDGYYRDDSYTAMTIGSKVSGASVIYASTTAGGITQTAPVGAGDVVQRLGHAIASKIIRFDPDWDWTVN